MNRQQRPVVDRFAFGLSAPADRRSASAGFIAASAVGQGTQSSVAAGDAICTAASPRNVVNRQARELLSSVTSHRCFCVQTVGHKPVCVTGFDSSEPRY